MKKDTLLGEIGGGELIKSHQNGCLLVQAEQRDAIEEILAFLSHPSFLLYLLTARRG